MTMIFEDEGSLKVLAAYFNDVWPSANKNLTLKLYTNNITPDASGGDTAATFTEAVGGDYSAKTLTNGSWTVSLTGDIAQAAYAKQTFTFTGALTTNTDIYGFYIVDADDDVILAERFAAKYTPTNNGDKVEITPIVKCSQGTPSV